MFTCSVKTGFLYFVAGGVIQIVQTASGQHILAPVSSAASSAVNGPTVTAGTVVTTPAAGGVTTAGAAAASVTKATSTTLQLPESPAVSAGKPVMRVSPVTQVSPGMSCHTR